jgi:hypothetical protein
VTPKGGVGELEGSGSSSFNCEVCGGVCLDSPRGYTTGCERYPAEVEEEVQRVPESRKRGAAPPVEK